MAAAVVRKRSKAARRSGVVTEDGSPMGRNFVLSSIFLISAGANKVLLRILLVLTSKYAFLLGVLTNAVYIAAFGLQFKVNGSSADEGGRKSRKESARFALRGPGLRLLAGSGACEAAAFVLLPLFASMLPGSLLPVMSQGLLIFSMAFSAVLLGRRYDVVQVLGVVVVAAGVGICTWPNLVGADGEAVGAAFNGSGHIFAALGLFLSYAFIALSLVLKELSFLLFKRWRKERSDEEEGELNLEMVNFATAIWQGLTLMLLWPVNFALLTKLSVPVYLASALSAFKAAGPWLLAYLVVNLVYTAATTSVLKQLSAVVFLLINVLNVPLVSLFFCFNLPLLGAATFRWSFVLGLGIIIVGLLTYNYKTLLSKSK